MKIPAFGLVCMLIPSLSFADPLTINVLKTQYTTTVSTGVKRPDPPYEYETTTRTTVSPSPITDGLSVLDVEWARATADLFSVTAQTNTRGTTQGYSIAAAESSLEFAPTQDGTGALDLAFTAGGEARFSEGRVSLVDLTLDEALWAYGWTYLFAGTVPWMRSPDGGGAALLTLETLFQADHLYALTLYTSTNANLDRQDVTISVSGVRTVPEPSTLLLVGTGLVGAGVRRWRRRRIGFHKVSG